MKYYVVVETAYEGTHVKEFGTLEDAQQEYDSVYSRIDFNEEGDIDWDSPYTGVALIEGRLLKQVEGTIWR